LASPYQAVVGNVFATKLGPVGNTLVYSTYLSGPLGAWMGSDFGNGIAVDG